MLLTGPQMLIILLEQAITISFTDWVVMTPYRAKGVMITSMPVRGMTSCRAETGMTR